MMKNRAEAARNVDEKSSQEITRRLWIQSLACVAAGVSTLGLLSDAEVLGQAPPLTPAIRAMTAVTGAPIEENWVGPTAFLVGIILDSSKGLRELNLGELEPATDFLVR
jgi:hypothetical protein